MRRTFALAGAAMLAVGLGGLAGPAAANDVGAVLANEDIKVVEVAVGGSIGSYLVLENFENTSVPLNGYRLLGCTATSSSPTTLTQFGSVHEIVPAGSGPFFLTVDPDNYTGTVLADAEFGPAGEGFLDQSDGGLAVLDNASPIPNVLHAMTWGTSGPAPGCMPSGGAEDAGTETPTSNQSTHRDSSGSWARGTFTPRSTQS